MTLPTTLTRTQPLLFLIEKLADYTLKKEEALDFILYNLGWASEVQSKDTVHNRSWEVVDGTGGPNRAGRFGRVHER